MKIIEKALEGHLSIYKYYNDGTVQKFFEEGNLIVTASKLYILQGLYSTPIVISSATYIGPVVTIVTATNHGLVTGDYVDIAGISPTAYNGTYRVIVVDNTTFQYYSIYTLTGNGSGTMFCYPTVAPDPINSLKIGIGGAIDNRTISNCSITINNNILTASTNSFLVSDVFQNVIIQGAGAGGTPLSAIIISYTDPTHVVISQAASTTISGSTVTIGQGLFPAQEDPLQSNLVAPVATLGITYTIDPVTPILTFIADADQNTANGLLITEAGLFKLSGGLFSVKNHPGIPKTSDFGIHYVWSIRYT